MTQNRALYEQVILEHNKTPRNFRAIENPDHEVKGFNPLCGDQFTIFLKMNGDRIDDISFQGNGCAISKSSASLMTTLVKGKTAKEAHDMFVKFHHMVTSEPDKELSEADLGKLMVFSGVREYPVRIKCATLAWYAMLNALEGKGEVASTE
ncbi:MAG: iron-sulfur cluster assembly scaffold protein NifU [Candidatus Hydrogenedentota bacterium]